MWQKFLLRFEVGNFYDWPANDFEKLFAIFKSIYNAKSCTLWMQIGFLLLSNFRFFFKARIFQCDKNFCFDLELEISTNDPQMTLKRFLGYLKTFTSQKLHNSTQNATLLLPSFVRFKLEFSSVTKISALIWSYKFLQLTRKWLWKPFGLFKAFNWEAKTLHNFNAKRFLVLPNSRYFKLEFSNVTEILLGFEAGNFYDWPANDFEKCLRYFKTFTSQKASQYERKTILIAFQFSTF